MYLLASNVVYPLPPYSGRAQRLIPSLADEMLFHARPPCRRRAARVQFAAVDGYGKVLLFDIISWMMHSNVGFVYRARSN